MGRAEATPRDAEKEDEIEAPEVDTWLKDFLSTGPKPPKTVFAAGRDDGYSKDQLKRAKGRLGAVSDKNGYQGEWAWSMPEGTFSDGGKGSKESPYKKTALPLHPLTEAPLSVVSSDCTLCADDASLLPLSEASNHEGYSDSQNQRAQRGHENQSNGKIIPLMTRDVTHFSNERPAE